MTYKEIPDIKKCIEIGTITRPHGKDGEVLVSPKNIDITEFTEYEYVFLCRQERLVPFFIESASVKSNTLFVKFEDIQSLEKAEMYCGSKIYLEQAENTEEESIDSDLVGFSVIDSNTLENIGTIQEVITYSMNTVFDVKQKNNNSVLIPFAEALFKGIDEAAKTITMEIPDGILEA